MKKLLFILITSFAFLTCSEPKKRFECFSKLPPEMQNEILHLVIQENISNLIQEYDTSQKDNRLNIFFSKFSKLFINKQAAGILRKYISARKNEMGFLSLEHLMTIAAEKNWENLFPLILKNSFSLNLYYKTYFQDAVFFLCANKNSKMLDILTNKLHIGSILNMQELISNFYAKIKDLQQVDNILHEEVKDDNFPAVKFLILNNTNLNKQNIYGESALTISIKYGREDIIKLLLAQDIDINIRDNRGNSILYYARPDYWNQYKDIRPLLYKKPGTLKLAIKDFLLNEYGIFVAAICFGVAILYSLGEAAKLSLEIDSTAYLYLLAKYEFMHFLVLVFIFLAQSGYLSSTS